MASGLQLSPDEVLDRYGHYVRSLAWSVRRQFQTGLDVEDLIAYGQVGLLEARERFEPGHGANFLTFAHYRIKGAIYDGLRKMGVLRPVEAAGARVESRVTVYLSALAEQAGARAAESGESFFEDDVRDVSDAVEGLALILAASLQGADATGEGALPADQRIEMRQLRVRVRRALERLPEKERALLRAYYDEEQTLEEAGAVLGLSKSWASRLHARAIDQLKTLLAEDELPPAVEERRGDHGRSSVEPGRGRGTGGASDADSVSRRRQARTLEV